MLLWEKALHLYQTKPSGLDLPSNLLDGSAVDGLDGHARIPAPQHAPHHAPAAPARVPEFSGFEARAPGTERQERYMDALADQSKHTACAIGPGGVGKTLLAVQALPC